MTTNKPGCLGFSFGFTAPTVPNRSSDSSLTAGDEGKIHSGPGAMKTWVMTVDTQLTISAVKTMSTLKAARRGGTQTFVC